MISLKNPIYPNDSWTGFTRDKRKFKLLTICFIRRHKIQGLDFFLCEYWTAWKFIHGINQTQVKVFIIGFEFENQSMHALKTLSKEKYVPQYILWN